MSESDLEAECERLRNTLETLSDSSVTAHAFLELKGQYETLLKYHEHFNMDLHDEGIKGDQARTLVATQEVELKKLRTREAALKGSLRRIYEYAIDSEPIADAMNMQDIAKEALTQSGVELEGV